MPTSILFRIIIDTHYFQGATSYACLKKEFKEHRRRVQEHNHIMIMQQGVMRVNSKVRYANVISKVGHLTNLTILHAEIQSSTGLLTPAIVPLTLYDISYPLFKDISH